MKHLKAWAPSVALVVSAVVYGILVHRASTAAAPQQFGTAAFGDAMAFVGLLVAGVALMLQQHELAAVKVEMAKQEKALRDQEMALRKAADAQIQAAEAQQLAADQQRETAKAQQRLAESQDLANFISLASDPIALLKTSKPPGLEAMLRAAAKADYPPFVDFSTAMHPMVDRLQALRNNVGTYVQSGKRRGAIDPRDTLNYQAEEQAITSYHTVMREWYDRKGQHIDNPTWLAQVTDLRER